MSGVLVQDVAAWIAELARAVGQPGLNADEGLRWGEPDVRVRGIQVCWMATTDAIEAAGAAGANLIIAHEALFHPHSMLERGGPADFLTWRTNQRRATRYAAHEVACIRFHGTLDRIHIYDAFAETLGLGGDGRNPASVDGSPYGRVYEIEPQSVGRLAERVKARTGMGSVRVAGDLDATVRRVGLPWGGMALFVNVGYMQRLVALGADVFIAGESDNYGMRFALEAGIPMIETSHEVSENPGLRRFTDDVARRFPGVPVSFYENTQCWQMA